MNVIERLADILTCPHDFQRITHCRSGFVCDSCQRQYSAGTGIVHFICSDEERPANPKALAKDYELNSKERLGIDYYRNQAQIKEHIYQNNPVVKEAVDFVVDRAGVAVDLATGHGGVYIAPIVRRLRDKAILIATGACPPVIANWSEYFRRDYADRFVFLDIDLSKPLCFADESIDIFSGLGIANVNSGYPIDLLKEVHRCLKPGGYAVLQEMFFAEESKTAKLLKAQNQLYASLSVFKDYTSGFGLNMTKTAEVAKVKGKIDPRDGMPIDESDSWAERTLYLEKNFIIP